MGVGVSSQHESPHYLFDLLEQEMCQYWWWCLLLGFFVVFLESILSRFCSVLESIRGHGYVLVTDLVQLFTVSRRRCC